jgi:hypothetical protein
MQDNVSVEDVMAYVRFIHERCALTEQTALAHSVAKLVDRVDAVVLGNVHRTHSHIRDVARRIILSRKVPPTEPVLTTIVQTLAEQVYAHGHAIGFSAAREIGLPVEQADATLEPLMWSLLEDYEDELKLLSPLDPAAAVSASDVYTEDASLCVVETEKTLHRFQGQIEFRAKRAIPSTLNVNMQLQMQAPQIGAQVTAQQLLQQVMQQAQQAILQQAQDAVQRALQQQAPLVGVDASFRSGTWVKST